MTQHLRRSQYVLTWGPGSILEGPDGPRIISDPDIGLFHRKNMQPDSFEIFDERMSKGLLNNSKIFRLPSNAELGWNEETSIYKTRSFPNWALCITHWILHRKEDGCPMCKDPKEKYSHGAIRFVVACPEGHMDDVYWDFIVHLNTNGKCGKGNYPKYYLWLGGGGNLSDIKIQCPKCKESIEFGKVYSYQWTCSGRYPEKEPLDSPPIRPYNCDSMSRIILRQSSSLRIPEIVSLFTVPPRYSKIHNILETQPIQTMLAFRTPNNMHEFEIGLNRLKELGFLKKGNIDYILNYNWNIIKKALDDLQSKNKYLEYSPLLLEEYYTLINASVNGAPPVEDENHRDLWFEVPLSKIRRIKSPNGIKFRIVPVTKLRTVIVQKGYRRLSPLNELQDISFTDEKNDEWYPGVEFLGEGIFIMFDEDEGRVPKIDQISAQRWKAAYSSPVKEYQENLFRGYQDRIELHPTFVWWHTFSHLLLRILAIDSGYTSASIRERVYTEITESGPRGGVILYTVQPGEGTMGGLISLTEKFERILEKSVETISSCPNDPLCNEQQFINGKYSGASCYGCLLVSETSCEHRNMWLDRHLLLEKLP